MSRNQYAIDSIDPDDAIADPLPIPDSPVWTPLLDAIQKLADGGCGPDGDDAIALACCTVAAVAGQLSFVMHLDEGSDWGHVTLGNSVVSSGHCDRLREWVLDQLIPTRLLDLPHVRRGDPHPTAAELYEMSER